jgi:predicted transcriptional regulators
MTNEFTIQLGQRIKTARESAGLTQSGLAELADISTNHVSALERGVYDTKAELLAKLATALGVDANYLLFGAKPARNMQLERAFRMAEQAGKPEKVAQFIIHGVELID